MSAGVRLVSDKKEFQMLTREDTRKQAGKYCNRKVQLWLQPNASASQWKGTNRDCFGWEKHQAGYNPSVAVQSLAA